MDVPGPYAAEQTVPHEFDGIAPDIAQAVAICGIDPPETAASHQVVAAGKEDDFLSPDDPVVPPVPDGNAELVHPYVTAVPEFLPIPDAEDIGPFSVSMMILAMMTVIPVGTVLVMAVMVTVVLMPEFLMDGIPLMIMMRLPRSAGNAEEQCQNEKLFFHDVFLLLEDKSNYRAIAFSH